MPERTCVCCRKKDEKKVFFRLSEIDGKYVFDENMKVQNRGFYVCKEKKCIEKLSKHKKYSIKIEELLKMLEKIDKGQKNIIDIIKPMKNSEFFIFGVDENIFEIKNKKVKLIILPQDINKKYIDHFLKLSKEYDVKIFFIKEKSELTNIFNRDVNIVGIFGKKVVNGILNKVEVTDEGIRIS